ncbi:MAG: PIN domain-containing protein [Prevotellaceae bacterium]|jgi:predicted nucleic acid-binding protein|nr:PIN domain-containing protein [Prevotellaceae bacterium]
MKKVFLDTNVLMDMLLVREPHNLYSMQVFELGRKKEEVLLAVSCLSMANAQYLLARYGASVTAIRSLLTDVSQACELVALNEKAVVGALAAQRFNDIENAMQHQCAKACGADVIITRDVHDFRHSDILTMSANEFLLSIGKI